MCSRALLLIIALLATPATAAPAPAVRGQVFLTLDEALALAFPDLDVTRGTQFLTKDEQKRVAKLSGLEFERGCIYPYVASKDGQVVGTAYFDNHRVRTLRETVMVVVTPDARIQRIEVLAFGEPTDYLPRDIWYAQFDGRVLDKELNLKRGIRGVAGATLTARATTEAARRTLAVHQVLAERHEPPERVAKRAPAGK